MAPSELRTPASRLDGHRQLRQVMQRAATAAGLVTVVLAMPAWSQAAKDINRLSGKELDAAWASRATTSEEAIGNLVRRYLVEQKIGTPTTTVRFVPYREVPIEEECQSIKKGKVYRLTASQLPSTVTLQWGKSSENGFVVGTALRYEMNGRNLTDNALKYFPYPTLVAIPLANGSYHAQVLIPTGPVFSQLAAIGKLYEVGTTVELDRYNSDYESPVGKITAVRLDDEVQRVANDHFLPLESFVSHQQLSPRQNKSRFRIGYIRDADIAFVVQNRVYDVFLIRNGKMRLSSSEPWTFIQNAKTYNNHAYQRRLEALCVTVFPDAKPKQAKSPNPGPARGVAALPVESAGKVAAPSQASRRPPSQATRRGTYDRTVTTEPTSSDELDRGITWTANPNDTFSIGLEKIIYADAGSNYADVGN